MDILYRILIDPFVQMGAAPDLLVQALWEGLVSGMLYALIALGFVLIYKASGVFNFAQGIMVVFAGLTLVGLYEAGIPAFMSLALTVGVMFAARAHPLRGVFRRLGEPGRWAALAHVLDYDDLHLPSTTHVSAVCVPAALASSANGAGDERAYLAGAGVMARLGTALGWRHYSAGWHATCTAGAPAAASPRQPAAR